MLATSVRGFHPLVLLHGEAGGGGAAAARAGPKVERDGKLQEFQWRRSTAHPVGARLLILSALARDAEVGRRVENAITHSQFSMF